MAEEEPHFDDAGPVGSIGFKADNVSPYVLTKASQREAQSILDGDNKPVSELHKDKYEREAGRNWDIFYKRNTTNAFKDRHYLSKEFTELSAHSCRAGREARTLAQREADDGDTTSSDAQSDCRPVLVDFGCGVGNAVVPLLIKNPHLRAIGFDISKRAIDFLNNKWRRVLANRGRTVNLKDLNADSEETTGPPGEQSAAAPEPPSPLQPSQPTSSDDEEMAAAQGQQDRNIESIPMEVGELVHGFVHDITKGDPPEDVCPSGSADFALLLFVLSALAPAHFRDVAQRISRVLRPGGVLMLRDYGRYDMAQLRFAAQRKCKIEENFYVRWDGTRTYYFTVEELREIFCGCGLVELENRYHMREIVNRKTEQRMRRIWIQAKFEKPSHAPAAAEET